MDEIGGDSGPDPTANNENEVNDPPDENEPSTSNLNGNESESSMDFNQVTFSRLRGILNTRSKRRKHVPGHDGNLSTTTDSDDDTISEPEPDNPNNNETSYRVSLSSSLSSTPTVYPGLDDNSVDESATESVYDEICNPKIPPNWFAIKEIYKRQYGYGAKSNGHLQFQRKYYGSLHVAQRLELMSMMEYHDGCVNALGFNPTGNLLASASDDLRVVIWDWAAGKRKTSWFTRHRNNVFQCKFLPLSGQSELQLVTSARDGQVWLWQLGQDGLRGSRKLGYHRGASHKLALVPEQPHVILSCGEDALVYRHDVREAKPVKLTFVLNKRKKRVPLYSIHSHPLKSTEFVVSGHDSAACVYDQRFLDKDCQPMKRYETKHKTNPIRHITSSVYNYCGNELLVSYNDDDIYLFDTTEPEGADFIHSYQGHRNEATIKNVNFFGPKSEYVISGSDCGNIFFWDKQSQGIVQFLLADKGVVNVLETHPSIPILASSGLDSDVKIWIPSREKAHKMSGLLNTVNGNMRIRKMHSECNDGEGSSRRISRRMWMIWQLMRRDGAGGVLRDDLNDEPGDDDDSEENEDDADENDDDEEDTSDTVELSDIDDSGNDHFECLPS